MASIGVIGCGIVGTAVQEGMKHAFDVHIFDIKKEGKFNSVVELFEEVEGPVFICVPTPMLPNGASDTSIVEGIVAKVNDHVRTTYGEPAEHAPLIVKSTVPPGTVQRFNDVYKYVRVVFNPEFLTEANANKEFKEQKRIIIGGPHGAATIVKRLYQVAYPLVPTTKTSSTIAEMIKYVTNCFLATKVAFANEMYQICSSLEVDYDKVIEYTLQDERMGKSHWAVPGPDGDFGYGLSCFPKDINALIARAEELKVNPLVMKAAWDKNLEVRKHRDWEGMKGRAVT